MKAHSIKNIFVSFTTLSLFMFLLIANTARAATAPTLMMVQFGISAANSVPIDRIGVQETQAPFLVSGSNFDPTPSNNIIEFTPAAGTYGSIVDVVGNYGVGANTLTGVTLPHGLVVGAYTVTVKTIGDTKSVSNSIPFIVSPSLANTTSAPVLWRVINNVVDPGQTGVISMAVSNLDLTAAANNVVEFVPVSGTSGIVDETALQVTSTNGEYGVNSLDSMTANVPKLPLGTYMMYVRTVGSKKTISNPVPYIVMCNSWNIINSSTAATVQACMDKYSSGTSGSGGTTVSSMTTTTGTSGTDSSCAANTTTTTEPTLAMVRFGMSGPDFVSIDQIGATFGQWPFSVTDLYLDQTSSNNIVEFTPASGTSGQTVDVQGVGYNTGSAPIPPGLVVGTYTVKVKTIGTNPSVSNSVPLVVLPSYADTTSVPVIWRAGQVSNSNILSLYVKNLDLSAPANNVIELTPAPGTCGSTVDVPGFKIDILGGPNIIDGVSGLEAYIPKLPTGIYMITVRTVGSKKTVSVAIPFPLVGGYNLIGGDFNTNTTATMMLNTTSGGTSGTDTSGSNTTSNSKTSGNVTLTNLTGMTADLFTVGDQWKISITGVTPNTTVWLYGGQNNNYDNMNSEGTTDANGNFVMTGTMQSGHIGTWAEVWKIGATSNTAVTVGSLGFIVQAAPGSGATGSPVGFTTNIKGDGTALGVQKQLTDAMKNLMSTYIDQFKNGIQGQAQSNLLSTLTVPATGTSQTPASGTSGGAAAAGLSNTQTSSSVTLTNLTGPSANQLSVGDQWKISITGVTPNTTVWLYGGQNNNYDNMNSEGTTDANGNFVMTGKMSQNDVGTWAEVWKIGASSGSAVSVGSLGFIVQGAGSTSATTVSPATTGSVTGSTVTSSGMTVDQITALIKQLLATVANLQVQLNQLTSASTQ